MGVEDVLATGSKDPRKASHVADRARDVRSFVRDSGDLVAVRVHSEGAHEHGGVHEVPVDADRDRAARSEQLEAPFEVRPGLILPEHASTSDAERLLRLGPLPLVAREREGPIE